MNTKFLTRMLLLLVGLQAGAQAAQSPLERWAGHSKINKSGETRLLRPATTNHPPVCLTACIKVSGERSFLAFRLTNISKTALKFDRFDLPWGNPYAITLAAITVDGEQVPNHYPIADRVVDIRGTALTLKPGESVEGDYELLWIVDLAKAPKSKDLLVLWSYEIPKDLEMPESRCTGVVILPKR